jgi:hypothetical protein
LCRKSNLSFLFAILEHPWYYCNVFPLPDPAGPTATLDFSQDLSMSGPDPGRGRVETYSGSRLHERPRRFTRGDGTWLEVRRILSQWRDPRHLRFQVLAEDQRIFLLSYDFLGDAWEVELSAPRPPES